MNQVKDVIAATIQDYLVSDQFAEKFWETFEVEELEGSSIEVAPLSPIQTTIRVRTVKDTPARYFTVQVKENL